MSRVLLATRLGLREQTRRPVLLVLLLVLPFFFITRAIAATEPLRRTVELSGVDVLTTMREIHGADMAAITIAFLSGLVGVFVVQASREADRRLVVAGFTATEAIAPRLLVLAGATVVTVIVSMLVTALSFQPRAWAAFVLGNLLVGGIYGCLGALAGVTVGRLGATYLVLFGAMLDLGIAQNPMFGSGAPSGWAAVLPGHGPVQIMLDAAFAGRFGAWENVAVALLWFVGLATVMVLVLRRQLGTASVDQHVPAQAPPKGSPCSS